MQVIVDGLAVNYLRPGSGKKIVLLHGWANSLSDLSTLAKDLAKVYEITTLDLPGFGASQTPDAPWGVGDFARFLADFCKKTGIDKPYAIIGHSNGGAIAIKAVAEGLIEPSKLILLASSGIREGKRSRSAAVKAMTKAAKVISSPLPSSTKKNLRRKLYSSLGSDLFTAENMEGSFKKVVAEDLKTDAAKLDLPTLLIYGEKDEETPIADGELYHQLIKDSTLEIIGGAGHFIQKEKPALVVKLIKDFLC